MRPTKQNVAERCGHYELAKTRGKWRCVACGQFFTVPESIQHFIDLSDVVKSAIESGRPLVESLDDLIGRKEWNQIRANLRTRKEPKKGKK